MNSWYQNKHHADSSGTHSLLHSCVDKSGSVNVGLIKITQEGIWYSR